VDEPTPTRQVVRFGVFELDLKAGDLRRRGVRIKLQEQPFQILRLLLARPGDVVTHDEIIHLLWPHGTVVEYEHSVKTAVKKLRQALGDDADIPRYVETLPRRGYRFIYPVEDGGEAIPPGKAPEAEAEAPFPAPAADLVGSTVSHYRIQKEIGSGGMGIVYRAEDLSLGRPVALKFLPTELATEPKALGRFQREAKAASALSHPNICTIYEVGEHEGRPFIAMELLEGQTLKDRLVAQGPPSGPADFQANQVEGPQRRTTGVALQLNEILDLAIQIADALEAAHAKGIIHRDIKPANIFVNPRGQIKVLDFGLAKVPHKPHRDAGGASALPTATAGTAEEQLTSLGVAVGTVAYMSPEQARGEELDARTDLFSFGAVLYEMATGRQAFSGTTSAVIFHAILSEAPTSPVRLNPDVPPKLEEIINKALEKDRELRYQTASDMRADLQRLKRDTDSGRAVAAISDRRTAVGTPPLQKRRWLAIALASAVVIAGAILAYWLARPPAPPPELKERRLTANPSENPVNLAAISPDGKYLAYSDQKGLHLKLLQTGEILDIPQPEGRAPGVDYWWPNGWFPDSTKFIASGGESSVQSISGWVISVMGGPPRKLRDDADVWSVSPDGNLIAFGTGSSSGYSREIWLMGPQGEEPRKLVAGSESDEFIWAAWSPDGQRIAYERFHRTPDKVEGSIESRDLKGGPPTVMLSGPRLVAEFSWLPSGRFVYPMDEPEDVRHFRGLNLWEVRVDKKTGEPVSKPRRITNWAETISTGFGVTSDGKQLAVTKRVEQAHVDVGELEAGGRPLKNLRPLTLEESEDFPCHWMPDGKTVLFQSNRNGTWGIYRQALDQTTAQAVVTGPDYKDWAVVSPDGSWILYLSTASFDYTAANSARIMRVPTSGGAPQLVLEGRGITYLACAQSPASLCVFSEESPDHKQLIFSAFEPSQEPRRRELTRVNLNLPGIIFRMTYGWDLCPDGSRLAITQYDERAGRIQILPLAGGEVREVNVKGWHGLWKPFWAADGKGLFVTAGTGQGEANLYVDLEGRAQVIWRPRSPGNFVERSIPSPDGRYLAVSALTTDSNVWLLENF
jgi:serine/threonine protein kinase/Tol biopolymer transport system component